LNLIGDAEKIVEVTFLDGIVQVLLTKPNQPFVKKYAMTESRLAEKNAMMEQTMGGDAMTFAL